VWRELQKLEPSAQAQFVVSTRPEDSEYLKQEGITPLVLEAPRRGLSLPLTLLATYRDSARFLNQFKPDAVFSKGGSLSVPLCFAAKMKGIPVVLHESDAVMGKANKMIAKHAETVCLGLPISQSANQSFHSIITGNPIRSSITEGERAEGLRITGFTGKRPTLLVFGGSQGAQIFNEWVIAHLQELLTFADVMHLTGAGKKGAAPCEGYFVKEFAGEELPHLYAVADLAVSRAGSGNIAELAACGIPSILIPIKGLAQDHQVLNAQLAQQEGGCLVVEQTAMEGKLLNEVRVTLADEHTRKELSQKIRNLYRPQAAKSIAQAVREAGKNHLSE
jgi:UDP-N-acetylglucosamine--N-acetylmuramyl-(pentapeptide) pyrophosphoryl-undecaprenol N-acetylglucosamine transferase